MSEKPISTLRARMIEDMTVRNLQVLMGQANLDSAARRSAAGTRHGWPQCLALLEPAMSHKPITPHNAL